MMRLMFEVRGDDRARGFMRKKGRDNMKKIETKSCEEIMSTAYKPLAYCVDGLLTQGLYILAGAPKVGKSWLALDICLSVAKGEDVLKHRTNIGTALYLCLEDSYHRIQNRLYDLTDEPTENLYFAILTTEALGNGLETQIEKFKSEHSDTKLIVIDTLQMVRNEKDCGYDADYKELSILKALADKLAITILLVHHTRKCYDSDPFNMISGSTGLRGCADGALVLIEKDRATHEATLYCEGRDIESRELKLQRAAHRWNLIADSCVSPERFDDEIITAMVRVMKEAKSFLGTPTELTDKINQHTKKQYIPNVVSRKILQSAQRLLEHDVLFEMKRSNGIRKIQAQYFGDDRDDSDDKNDVSSPSAVDPVRNDGTA